MKPFQYQRLTKSLLIEAASGLYAEGAADASIDFNHLAAGRTMMRALVRRGHRDILVLTPNQQHPVRFEQCAKGAMAYLKERGWNPSVRTSVLSESTQGQWQRRMEKLLRSRQHRPTALLCTGIFVFFHIKPVLEKWPLRIPADLSLIGRGCAMLPAIQAHPWIDLVDQDFGRLGRDAARLLLRLVKGEPVPHATLLEMPRLRGNSIRSVPSIP